jgi:2-haloacid dehalogenase
MKISTIIFDIGNVLHEWSPSFLYKKILDSDQEIEEFLEHICNEAWNLELDRGASWDKQISELVKKHPEKKELITAYNERWIEMAPREIAGSVEIMRALKSKGYPIYALTNYSREKLELASKKFAILTEFDGMVVSSDVGYVKPEPEIYKILLEKFNITPGESIFIDDRPENIDSAKSLGIHGINFTSANQLRNDLQSLNIL